MQILTFYERQRIELYRRFHWGPREIGRRLKRNHTIISREIHRNTNRYGKYVAADAQRKADFHARKTNKRRLETDWKLHDWVETKLKAGWSPELIAGKLKESPPQELAGARISHEQIYQYIYEGAGRFEGWYHLLLRKHHRRQKRRGRKKHTKTLIKERIFIMERPLLINDRKRYGDWESDLVAFKKQREALAVQYERKSMLIRAHRVANKTAPENEQALMKTLESVPPEFVKSLTFDNGGENACHTTIRDTFDVDTFFCRPYAAWQKGGVENAIGLLRRYLPKDTNLATLTDEDLSRIQERLNNRPRKKLNYQTPNEVLKEHLSGALNS